MIKEIEFRGKTIPLRDDVTIIIGPNGCGKTELLEKIHRKYHDSCSYRPLRNRLFDVVCINLPCPGHPIKEKQSPEIAREMCEEMFDGFSYDTIGGANALINIMLGLYHAGKHAKENSEYRTEIILFDLPETFLHILWQERLSDYFFEWSRETGIQVVITTHSPHMIAGHFENVEDIS